MEQNPFRNNELCDGGCCGDRSRCARYMGNIDPESPGVNFYIILNKRPFDIGCPFRLERDADPVHYPQNTDERAREIGEAAF